MHKNKLKCVKDLNIRPDTIKLLEENRGRTCSEINHSKILYDPPPRVMKIKTNKWDLIKFKSFCTMKETISKVKRQPSEWEKIRANETTDKDFISKIYKQLMQLSTRKMNNPINKWVKELNRHFSKEDMLLLLSRFSRVRLCAIPETAAHQAPPSLGFSRQEHWSGLPFPSPMHESEK